jgi:preprotein translocase subunit SecA
VSFRQQYLNLTGVPIEYDIDAYAAALDTIDALAMADVDTAALRARAAALAEAARTGTPLDDLLTEVFAVTREAAGRTIGLRPFDVQMAAAVALARGKLAQLATGEGKTLVAVLPALLHALTGGGVHVFTANDYLAQRDAEWMRPVYEFFGLRVGSIVHATTRDARRQAYAADVTYLTAKEAGFDFLRDHTATDPDQLVGRRCAFVIVDEADFILIDEARVPLVIAGPAPDPSIDPRALAALVKQLRVGVDFDVDEYGRTVALTETGFRRAESLLGGIALNDTRHQRLLSGLHVALHAQHLLVRDRDYVVRRDRIELVDEWTGRVAENRRWPHGIQAAVEAKEAIDIEPEGKVLGSIPIQHFVTTYPKAAAMTATAVPAAEEFAGLFGLTTVAFPPNRACRRIDEPDVVFTHRSAKMKALVDEIVRVHETRRPVLVGTASVGESEELAAVLRQRRVKCRVLNARHDARESVVIRRAGMPGAVTISTNMAGRGTDIVLGGGDAALHAEVCALGGLYVIGTNRHESRRIDDQLRGRAGRQGDPGSSRFFISLQDDLIQRYGVMTLIPKAHRPTPHTGPIDDPIVAREIARAQRIVEGQNYEIRKTLWRYSQLVDEQRRIVYETRQALLTDADEIEPETCAIEAAEHYRTLVTAAGAAQVRRAIQRLMIKALDRGWAAHLALIDDIREGIHLQRYGGKEPLIEFQRQIVENFDAMMKRVESETVTAFRRLTLAGGAIDFERAGLGGSTATWTYLVNDNPFSTLGLSLMASRNIGIAAGAGFMAAASWPITLGASIVVLIRRWLRRRQ